MSEIIKRELLLGLQFFAFVLLACLGAFVTVFIPGGDYQINIAEAWKNVEPFVGRILFIFAFLCIARLALVLAASKLRPRPE